MARVVLEIMPTNLRTISPASPPPLAWKDVTTVAVLTSILPPMAPVGRTASAGSSVENNPRPLHLAACDGEGEGGAGAALGVRNRLSRRRHPGPAPELGTLCGC